ncbi:MULTISPECIES: HEPN domain-containing protein [unclassified Pseudomonas]|uniref:HEPN domain-containing protein n=1 Tax=unclassified Pseudomonas TaxID=196821 RepID=UPI000917301A|nr:MULTISPECIES: HEPN domain-containing protein [unclassified Pseudomonas]SFY17438.1 hypothetical protein SAMN03159442_04496 [Pseudomonas sp. NFACC47-1]SFY40558.1 hypothetical protein SAMN03159352_04846 [Pseudomonas sp. NFACC43]
MDERLAQSIYWLFYSRPKDGHPEIAYANAERSGDRLRSEILTLINEEDEFKKLIAGYQVIGASRNLVSPEIIAAWMSSCVRTNYGRDFTADLANYLENDSFQAYGIVLLAGIEVDQTINLGNFGSLTNIYQLPNKVLQLSLSESLDENALAPQYSAALVVPFNHPLLIGQARLGEQPKIVSDLLQVLEDVVHCLTLCSEGSIAVQRIATAIVAADEVPCFGPAVWEYHSFHVVSELSILSEEDVKSAIILLTNLYRLNERQQNQIRLPLGKLHDFYSCNNISEAAVLLRTSLESLFLDNDSGELSHRLSIRAALLTGGAIEERLATYRMIKKAYEHGSAAVHRGKISSKKPNEVERILEKTAAIAKHAIKMYLSNPFDDWLTLELGGELQGS